MCHTLLLSSLHAQPIFHFLLLSNNDSHILAIAYKNVVSWYTFLGEESFYLILLWYTEKEITCSSFPIHNLLVFCSVTSCFYRLPFNAEFVR